MVHFSAESFNFGLNKDVEESYSLLKYIKDSYKVLNTGAGTF